MTVEHLISAVPETSPLWPGTVLSVRPHGDTGMWVIEHRSCGLFWTRFHDWMPDLHNAAQFAEEKAVHIADGLALHLVTRGIEVAETLRAARSAATGDDPQ